MSQLPTNSYQSIPVNLSLLVSCHGREAMPTLRKQQYPKHRSVGHQLAIFKSQLLQHVTLGKLRAQPGVGEPLHMGGITFPQLETLWSYRRPDDQAVGFKEWIGEFTQLAGPVDP